MHIIKLLLSTLRLLSTTLAGPLHIDTSLPLGEDGNLIKANDPFKDSLLVGMQKMRSAFFGELNLWGVIVHTNREATPSASYLDFQWIYLFCYRADPSPMSHAYTNGARGWENWGDPAVSPRAINPEKWGGVLDLNIIRITLEEADHIVREAGYTGKYRTIQVQAWPGVTDKIVYKFRIVRGEEWQGDYVCVGVGVEDGQIYTGVDGEVEEKEEALEELTRILN